MQTGSLVVYTGTIGPEGTSVLAARGLKEPKREHPYEVTSTDEGLYKGRKAMFITIDEYPDDVVFLSEIFTEIQGPGEVNISELMTEPAELVTV